MINPNIRIFAYPFRLDNSFIELTMDVLLWYLDKSKNISLKNVSNKERHLVSIFLKSLTTQLFNDIRMGMRKLSVDDVKEI